MLKTLLDSHLHGNDGRPHIVILEVFNRGSRCLQRKCFLHHYSREIRLIFTEFYYPASCAQAYAAKLGNDRLRYLGETKAMHDLETTTKNGDQVMLFSIMKELSITREALIAYAKGMPLNISAVQNVVSLDDAKLLIEYVHQQQQKLYFNPDEWSSHSSIDDFQNTVIFIDSTLEAIDRQTTQHQGLLESSNDAYKELLSLDVQHADLLEIKHYLLAKFDFSLMDLKEKLILMKAEALTHLEKVDQSVSLWDDEKIAHIRINFPFTATKIIRLYENQMAKIEKFSSVASFFAQLLDAVKAIQQEEKIFNSIAQESLNTLLKDAYLETQMQPLCHEWCVEVDKINHMYLQVIKAYFVGRISAYFLLKVFAVLADFKQGLNTFYLEVRVGFVVKYKDNPKSELLQKIATQARVFKLYQGVQIKCIALLKKEGSTTAYRFLNNLLSAFMSFHIDESSEGYEEVYAQLVQLHAKNLEVYLDDMERYGQELEKKHMAIETLMFKMQSDLESLGA